MASPGDKKGQRKGSCGHIMAAFDSHDKCARCREKRIGEDNCVLNKQCLICDNFTESQKELLATPSYRIRKEKKAGILVSPKDVTVISQVDTEPTFHSESSAQPPASPSASASSSTQATGFVTSEQLTAISDKSAEQFARMEALLSRGNIFSTPVSTVKPVDSQNLISDTPFLAPATRPTGPVLVPVAADAQVKTVDDHKSKKKTHKSRREESSHKSKYDSKSHKKCDRSKSPARKQSPVITSKKASPPVDPSSGPEAAGQSGSIPTTLDPEPTLQGTVPAGSSSTAQLSAGSLQSAPADLSTGAGSFLPESQDFFETVSDVDFDKSESMSGTDEGQISDSTETPEQTEDMSYRETVRSVRAFMGWNHIPTFESDFAEPDKSNNPWKGKQPRKPTRISVAMPPDDWLCQKLERLNLTIAEGYPSRAQDSAGLKRDQFVKVPKSQSRWYKMHMIKPDGPHRPGRSVFSWHDSEAKVNSQFRRITKASSYPPAGPLSRPISQESLRRWEKAARENSYIINHAAGFNRCSTELHDKMSQNINLLSSRISKGKAPREVSGALNDLRDLMAFHQKVSIAMGTSLQHLADNLFVHLSNLILIRRDSYLEFVKAGVKQDTTNLLRNAPLFGYGLFPDAAIMTAEQDIQKHETSSGSQRPGPGASQTTSWRGAHRYRPYDAKDRKPFTVPSDNSSQQQQPWRQFGRNRSRGRGRGRGGNPRFSKSHQYKPYK